MEILAYFDERSKRDTIRDVQIRENVYAHI